MKNRDLIALLASIALILALLLPGCGGAQIGGTDRSYRALNPQGIAPSVEISPLASRLDTFDGKTIYVNMAEADPVIMPALYERLQKDYTKTTWKWIGVASHGPSTPEQEVLDSADAVIKGVAW